MKEINDIKVDHRSNLRFVLIIVYLLIITPMIFVKYIHLKDNKTGIMGFILIFGIYVFLEVLEYLKFKYRYNSIKLPGLFFYIRLLAVVIFLIKTGNYFSPEIFSLYPLLIFYGYFAFVYPVNLFFLIIAEIFVCIENYKNFFITPQKIPVDFLGSSTTVELSYTFMFFILNQLILMILFYLFAWFWDKDRIQNDDNQRLIKELHHTEMQLRSYAREIAQNVALEERTRLARDIHDSVGHALTAIQIQLANAEIYMERNKKQSLEALKISRETAKEAMTDIRASLDSLNNKDIFSFKKSVKKLVQQLESADYKVFYTFKGNENNYNYSVLLALYRFIQEGITNILKHSSASKVELDIILNQKQGVVTLCDNGCGFDSSEDSPLGGKYGLIGMQQRLEQIKGHFVLKSIPGGGTSLSAVVPRDPVLLIGGEIDEY